MNKKLIVSVFLVVLLSSTRGIFLKPSGMLSAAATEKTKATALPVAYEFSLDTIDGKKAELVAYKGKVVFLDFWASWCPPCRASMPAVKKLHEKYSASKDFVIVGINMENIETARRHAAQSGTKYVSAVGNDITVRRYGVRGIPTFILINKKGEIIRRWVGFGEPMYEEWIQAIDEALQEKLEEAPSPASRKQPVKKPQRAKRSEK